MQVGSVSAALASDNSPRKFLRHIQETVEMRKFVNKLFLTIAVGTLIVIVVATLILIYFLGMEAGLFAGVILLLLLGGVEALWEIAMHSSDLYAGENFDKHEKDNLLKKMDNNPTIR